MSPRDAIEQQIETLQARLDSSRDPHERARLTTLLRQVKEERSALPFHGVSPT